MKNKLELLLAAQKSAAETLTVTQPLALVKARLAAFESLSIGEEHFVEFSNAFDAARNQYLANVSLLLNPTAA